MRAYVAGASDGDAAALAAIERALAGAGHERVRAEGRAAFGDRAAFESVFDALKEADIVVAEASRPSLDAGWALAWQLARARLAVVCVREDARDALGALVRGNPSPWQRLVIYRDVDDLERRLGALLG